MKDSKVFEIVVRESDLKGIWHYLLAVMIAIGIMMAIAGYNLPDPMPMGLW
jgi:hypothetical protein